MNNDNAPNAGLSNQLGAHLQAAIAAANGLRKDPGVDKKWLNKIIARLEETEAFTARLYKPEVASLLGQPLGTTGGYVPSPTGTTGCTCPMSGVLDTNCPVHGGGRT